MSIFCNNFLLDTGKIPQLSKKFNEIRYFKLYQQSKANIAENTVYEAAFCAKNRLRNTSKYQYRAKKEVEAVANLVVSRRKRRLGCFTYPIRCLIMP